MKEWLKFSLIFAAFGVLVAALMFFNVFYIGDEVLDSVLFIFTIIAVPFAYISLNIFCPLDPASNPISNFCKSDTMSFLANLFSYLGIILAYFLLGLIIFWILSKFRKE